MSTSRHTSRARAAEASAIAVATNARLQKGVVIFLPFCVSLRSTKENRYGMPSRSLSCITISLKSSQSADFPKER
jgi:hypothetical protein